MKKIKDKRKRGLIEPKPQWAEAFMILLLHKADMLETKLTGKSNGAILTVSVAALKRFEELKTNNKTLISFDQFRQTVTIRAPELTMPKVPQVPEGPTGTKKIEIVTPQKKIITKLN